jgi:hypothetical protein
MCVTLLLLEYVTLEAEAATSFGLANVRQQPFSLNARLSDPTTPLWMYL